MHDLVTRRFDDTLCVWTAEGTGRTLVVVFSGVGIRSQRGKPDFVRTAQLGGRAHVLYLADPQRSWLNDPGLIELMEQEIEAERRRVNADRVLLMGVSLGAYSAIVFGGRLPGARVLAFSPQVVVDPKLVPAERRWRLLRHRIKAFRIASAFDRGAAQSEYVVIFGDAEEEAIQRNLVPDHPQVSLTILPGTGHNTALQLKTHGLLQAVTDRALLGDFADMTTDLTGIVTPALTDQTGATQTAQA